MNGGRNPKKIRCIRRGIVTFGIAALYLVRVMIGGVGSTTNWDQQSDAEYNSTSLATARNNAPRTSTDEHGERRVNFVPFPHKSLGSGDDAQCTWTTRSPPENSHHDAIQLAAFAEGVCIPPKLTNTMHIFSTAEAIECLSPAKQQRNISVTTAGDSYTRQLFIGLADILLGRPSKEETKLHEVRIRTLEESNAEIAHRHRNDTLSFPNVQYKCSDECYGYGLKGKNFSELCTSCMNQYTKHSQDAMGVVGAGVHVLRHWGKQLEHDKAAVTSRQKTLHINPGEDAKDGVVAAVNATIDDIQNFLDMARQTIYVSMPSYEIEKVPLPYKNATHNTHAGRIHEGLSQYLAPYVMEHPFIDVFQLTRACHWKNCSYDGGHR